MYVDIFEALKDPADPERLRPDLTRDKLHPNGRGQRMIGDRLSDTAQE